MIVCIIHIVCPLLSPPWLLVATACALCSSSVLPSHSGSLASVLVVRTEPVLVALLDGWLIWLGALVGRPGSGEHERLLACVDLQRRLVGLLLRLVIVRSVVPIRSTVTTVRRSLIVVRRGSIRKITWLRRKLLRWKTLALLASSMLLTSPVKLIRLSLLGTSTVTGVTFGQFNPDGLICIKLIEKVLLLGGWQGLRYITTHFKVQILPDRH